MHLKKQPGRIYRLHRQILEVGFLAKVLYCSIYILAIPPFIILLASTYFSKKIDLKLSGYTANYKGRSIKHILPELCFILFPVLIFLLMKYLGHPELTFRILGMVGVLGFLSINYLYTIACKAIAKRRYNIISLFRN